MLVLRGDASGHVRQARLSDGSTLDVDVVLASLGSIRNVEWLEGSGLAAGFWGVGCDAGCRVFDLHGLVTNHIFVAGDIARSPGSVGIESEMLDALPERAVALYLTSRTNIRVARLTFSLR